MELLINTAFCVLYAALGALTGAAVAASNWPYVLAYVALIICTAGANAAYLKDKDRDHL